MPRYSQAAIAEGDCSECGTLHFRAHAIAYFRNIALANRLVHMPGWSGAGCTPGGVLVTDYKKG